MKNSFSATFDHLNLLNHPFYQAWMEGRLPVSTLRDYAEQYFFHVNCFPRYLSALHSLCENEKHRKILLENLNDEEGTKYGVSHPELWLQFAEGLGSTRHKVFASKPCAEIQNVVDTFFKHSRSSFHNGLGALYAYEAQVPEVAESKLRGLREKYNINDEKTLAFFEVHKSADVEHRSAILNILESFSEEEKAESQKSAQEMAQCLWDFLTGTLERQEVYV
jgi:pyrroloquinoline-quinone synthase